jgi:hypothetical protein
MKKHFILTLLFGLTLAGCTANPSVMSDSTPFAPSPTQIRFPETSTPVEAAPETLATPQSDSPAAGICDFYPGDLVTFEIYPDMPSPRCARATPGQRLRVVNRTEQEVRFWIGGYEFTLQPSQEQVIDAELSTYLAPGVHQVSTTAYVGEGGPELWLTTDP